MEGSWLFFSQPAIYVSCDVGAVQMLCRCLAGAGRVLSTCGTGDADGALPFTGVPLPHLHLQLQL